MEEMEGAPAKDTLFHLLVSSITFYIQPPPNDL